MEILGMEVPLWLILILTLLFAYYKYMTMYFGIFKKTPGLKGPKPLPIVGNLLPMLKNGFFGFDKNLIEKYGKVVPIFQGRSHTLIVADADMLKEILVKQYESFNERIPFNVPPPLDDMLTIIKDEQWKQVRNAISPTFSAEKLKRMNEPINNCCAILVKHVRKFAEQNLSVDVRDLIGAFTMDVIAATAFGLDIDSQADPNNTFVKMAKRGFVDDFFNPWFMVAFFLPFLSKPLAKWFNLGFLPADATHFFTKTIEKILAERTEEDESRKDFIQLMISAQQDNSQSKGKRPLTRNEVVAQGVIFFFAGFDTVANTCSAILYCLAMNPEVQEHLNDEITSTFKSDEKPTYETVREMTYLDKVMNESMRLFPVVARTDRRAQRDVTINGVFIPNETQIVIPIEYLHSNPEIFPDPEKFDPERFNEEAKTERDPMFFQPFGAGPRHCVAMRLAQMEVKMATVYIVRNFKIVTCDETPIPLKRNGLNGRPVGLKLKFEKRDQ